MPGKLPGARKGKFTRLSRKSSPSNNCFFHRAYWNIGRHIVEYEQDGIPKAEYGTALLERLADDLRKRHGHGFSRSNVSYMRLFYVKYPICETLSHKLTWSHYFELLKISNDLERSFYEKQCISENWSVFTGQEVT